MEKHVLEVNDVSIRFNLSKEKVDNLKELIFKKIKGEKIRFYLNYSWEEQRVEAADDFEVILGSADSTKREIHLSAWDVCIIKFDK